MVSFLDEHIFSKMIFVFFSSNVFCAYVVVDIVSLSLGGAATFNAAETNRAVTSL